MCKPLIKTLIASFMFLCANPAFAQTPVTRLSGKIAGSDGKPVSAATVTLLRAKDSVQIKTITAKADGSFAFSGLVTDTYKLQISATGYQRYNSEALIVRDSSKLNLSLITLINLSKTLGAVEITAQKKYIEQKIDRTVVNVNALISNNGANALEVLQNAPGVTVDENGVISFKGKSSVLVLIDDKPTYLSADNLASYLRSLPSSALDKIELMDNPPARYDAAGNAGVINIKTKKVLSMD